ncbi:MAG: TIM-barrel domain-containing protein [Actinomycetota bacterium]
MAETNCEGVLAGARLCALSCRLSSVPLGAWQVLRRKTEASLPMEMPVAEQEGPGVVRLRLRSPAVNFNHLELTLTARPGERFVGFGERFNAVDQRGNTLDVWTREGPISFGEKASSFLAKFGAKLPFPSPTATYKPLPWYISSRNYGLLIDTSAPVFYDVCASDARRIVCQVAAPKVDVLVITGDGPAQILERMTAIVGRTPGLPDWGLGPWNDAVGGEGEVRRVARTMREQGIPSSAIWYEDWGGGRWVGSALGRKAPYVIFPVPRVVDRKLYPNVESLNDELHEMGIKALAYFMPYIPRKGPDFDEALAKGYLVTKPDGKPHLLHIYHDAEGHLDLTNPGARAWYRAYMDRAIDLGFDGWMHDFGEYLPLNCKGFNGETGRTLHNRFPLLWAELARETLEARKPDGDFVFFSRSCGLRQQSVSPVFWCGDSDTDMGAWDGLPTNTRALISAGLSGISVWATDVGGYMSFFTDRDHETFARWAEFAALTPVMRTHHGTHPRRAVQPTSDSEALAQYARCAKLHTALFPTFRALVEEAKASGLPVCRGLMLHHPDDEEAWDVEDEFLVGRDLLVAPVLERGARSRQVYLPSGADWVDLWSGKRHPGGYRVTVKAPIGVIPLFLRADGSLVTFDTRVDTLVRRNDKTAEGLKTLDDAERSLAITLGPDFAGSLRLYDGTVVKVGKKGEASGKRVKPADHELLPSELVASWRVLGAAQGKKVAVSAEGAAVEISGAIARRVTVYRVG